MLTARIRGLETAMPPTGCAVTKAFVASAFVFLPLLAQRHAVLATAPASVQEQKAKKEGLLCQ